MKKPRKPSYPNKYDYLYFQDSDGDFFFSTLVDKIGEIYFGEKVTLKKIIDKYGEEFLHTISFHLENKQEWDPYEPYNHVELYVTVESTIFEQQSKEYDEKMLEYNKQLEIYKQYEKTKSRKKVP